MAIVERYVDLDGLCDDAAVRFSVSVQFHPSTRTSKKFMAVFTLDNDHKRTVHFGSAGASDYTQHRDPVRKRQYLARHAPREHWENPMTAGALSRWIL